MEPVFVTPETVIFYQSTLDSSGNLVTKFYIRVDQSTEIDKALFSKYNTFKIERIAKKVAIGTAAVVVGAVVGAGAAVVAAPLVLGAVGFSAGGVVAGSIAAGWQASIGNVVAGSLFASLQSAGAAGFAASTTAGIGAAGGVAGAGTAGAGTGISKLVRLFRKRKVATQAEEETHRSVETQVKESDFPKPEPPVIPQ